MQSLADLISEHVRVVEESRAVIPDVDRAVALSVASLRAGGKLLVCGNGGSAADSQHFAAELVARFEKDRPALSAIALTTDTSSLTAIGNDFGYEYLFSRQVAALARKGDVLFAISTSGNSPNILAAAKEAHERGCQIVAFTGLSGGKLAALADVLIAAPSKRVARIQEVHEICLHYIAQTLEELCS